MERPLFVVRTSLESPEIDIYQSQHLQVAILIPALVYTYNNIRIYIYTYISIYVFIYLRTYVYHRQYIFFNFLLRTPGPVVKNYSSQWFPTIAFQNWIQISNLQLITWQILTFSKLLAILTLLIILILWQYSEILKILHDISDDTVCWHCWLTLLALLTLYDSVC